MTKRFLPYASSPVRTMGQLISDVVATCWTVLWVWIGLAVHSAIATLADAGRRVESGADGIGNNLDSAGDGAGDVPLIGDVLSKPLTAAGQAAHDIADAGHSIYTTATWLAMLLALAVAAPPILAVTMPWLVLRIRFFVRKRRLIALASTSAGEQLLALRALTNRPLRRLATVHPDPVGAWRREDYTVIRGLAALELRSAGVGFRPRTASE
jgi:hypothetical protein